MPGVTLFDVAHLFETDSPPPCAAGAPPASEPPAPESPERRTRTSDEPRTAPARDDASVTTAAPEVEVRISKRRKKTSEAKWVGGRIVVSLPAHLNVESRQKTVDWLVERLLTRHQLQSGLDDAGLLARAIELSDRYLVGARPQSVRWVTNQTARWGSCSYYSGHIRLSHRLRVVPGVGARLRTGARGRPSDPPRPLACVPQVGRRLPAPPGGGRVPGRLRPGPGEPHPAEPSGLKRARGSRPLRPARLPGSARGGAGSRWPHRA